MDYNQTLEWLFGQLPMFSRTGAPAYKPGLDTSYALDNHFGHPHRNFRSIHIAGTNGKGSTSHMIAAILQSQGYKVGLYTSPHLVDFRERIRINGKMISREAVVDFVGRYLDSNYPGHPSFFELTMMMAFDWFSQNEVDFAIIETGMGGRLDSTNIITPITSVITNISFDHTQFLGDTLSKIATEKAGIIKPKIPVVIGELQESVSSVFLSRATEIHAPIIFAEKETNDYDTSDLNNIVDQDNNVYRCGLQGDYQQKNVHTVLATIQTLQKYAQVKINQEAIVNGLENVIKLTGLAGRWMMINERPTTIADTGHNEAGLRYNMEQLNRLMELRSSESHLRLVLGFVADKAVSKIIPLLPRNAEYYLSEASIPRAMKVDELYRLFNEAGIKSKPFDKVRDAYDAAVNDTNDNDIIYIGGSTFVVADLLATLPNWDGND